MFVTAFGMGVDGVAWATFLCQGVSCVLALAFVFRRLAKIHLPEGQRAPVFSGSLLGRVARVRLVAAAVREPPGVQAHAHAHVVRACELALGALELAGRHRGAQRAHACRRELASRGCGVVIERKVRVQVKDARLASGVGWRRPRRHRSPLSQRHGS